jgi:hypothetical protein
MPSDAVKAGTIYAPPARHQRHERRRVMDDMRETVESRRDEMTAGPTENFEQMEHVAVEARQSEEQHPSWTQGQDIPVQDVPQEERLSRPVATETDSY